MKLKFNPNAAQDPSMVNVRNDAEVQFWSDEMGVDQKTLTAAVKAVGPSVEKVQAFLGALAPQDSAPQ